MSDVAIPGGRIRSFVERELSEQKKEVFSEAIDRNGVANREVEDAFALQ
jgi:hypothetical protein